MNFLTTLFKPNNNVITSKYTEINKTGIKEKRLEYIDTLRVLACFLVLLTHGNMGGHESQGLWIALISFFGSPSSELFLSLSGTVLLPVKTSIKTFYKKRFLKLIPPLLVWSIIVVFTYYFLGKHTLAEGIEKLLFIPLRPVHGIYWFVYVMIGLYLFAPYISKWLENASKKSIEWFLILWCVNMSLPWIKLFIDYDYQTAGSHYWQLNYFGGFLGYWILGYYLRLYPVTVGKNSRWLIILSGTIIYCIMVAIIKLTNIKGIPYMDNLQIGSAFLVALIYTIIQNYPIKSRLCNYYIKDIAKCSFGIYLIHIIVVREIIWKFFQADFTHPFILSFIIAFVAMIICYIIIKIISFIPGSKYIIGI